MEKPPLPIKTKIAVWWLIVISGISCTVAIVIVASFYFFARLPITGIFSLLLLSALPWPILLFSFSISLLLTRKKGAWLYTIGITGISILSWFILGYCEPHPIIFGISLIWLVPFILLLLDRKNFWKIAS